MHLNGKWAEIIRVGAYGGTFKWVLIWEYIKIWSDFHRDNPGMSQIHFVRNYYCFAKTDLYFWLASCISYSNLILCSNGDFKDSWAHQILQRAHENFQRPIKIWMGYGPLAHFKGPSSFWARIIPDFDNMQCNLPNCPLWSIFVQLNINQWEPYKDQLCKVCLNQTNSESYDAVWSKLLRMSKSQICRKFWRGKCVNTLFEYHRLNGYNITFPDSFKSIHHSGLN